MFSLPFEYIHEGVVMMDLWKPVESVEDPISAGLQTLIQEWADCASAAFFSLHKSRSSMTPHQPDVSWHNPDGLWCVRLWLFSILTSNLYSPIALGQNASGVINLPAWGQLTDAVAGRPERRRDKLMTVGPTSQTHENKLVFQGWNRPDVNEQDPLVIFAAHSLTWTSQRTSTWLWTLLLRAQV